MGGPPRTPGRVGARRGGEGLQERLEASRAGRWLLSAALAFTVGSVVLWNLPESAIRDLAVPVVEPFVNATGLDQAWNLFAPNPPQRTYEVVARIDYADGSAALWRSPRNDRWRKWLGVVRADRSRRLWTSTAAWIAEHHDAAGRRTQRVELILRQRDLPPPGSGESPPPWREDGFYTYEVPGGGSG
ncbi:MAG TPA: hypothetical protein VNT56_07880 [Acidimicrobiales bacterium]|jgi:hypothetical protein|nr:hypothetical protein [Acidimicrobiales bacterium]